MARAYLCIAYNKGACTWQSSRGASRKGTGGHANAVVHLAWCKKLSNKPLKDVELHELRAVVAARKFAPGSRSYDSERGSGLPRANLAQLASIKALKRGEAT